MEELEKQKLEKAENMTYQERHSLYKSLDTKIRSYTLETITSRLSHCPDLMEDEVDWKTELRWRKVDETRLEVLKEVMKEKEEY